MINCIILVLLLLVSMILLKCANSPLFPNDYSCKDTFFFVSEIKNANLSRIFLVSYDVTSLFTHIPFQETIHIAINLIFNHNLNLNINKKNLKIFSFLLHYILILFLIVSFIIKSMEELWAIARSHSSCPC